MNKLNNNMNQLNYNDQWNQWFAGITDGDGGFYISKSDKTVSFEITTHTTDVRSLYIIKNTLKAGTVMLRAGTKSVRYRIKKKPVIAEIIERLNGKLRHPNRVLQFKEVCRAHNVPYIPAPPLIPKDDAYLSGLIDSDGSFAISVAKSSAEDSQISGVAGRATRLVNARGNCQISLKVNSSYEDLLYVVKDSYGYGSIYLEKATGKDKSPNDKYHWTITSYEDFLRIYEYLKRNPLKTVKMHRMRLSLLYFKYKSLKYHLKPAGTVESKIWAKFAQSWYTYSY